MYCKNCNKDYTKKDKLCKKCGIALVPGKAQSEDKGINKKVIIIGVAVALVVVAAFLTVGLLGMVPSDIKGTWYEIYGADYEYEFLTFGKIEFKGNGQTYAGTYEYDSSTKTGKIFPEENSGEDRDFSFGNATITMGDATFTREYVEQFSPESIFDEILEKLDTEE